jgi:hypothetical protein
MPINISNSINLVKKFIHPLAGGYSQVNKGLDLLPGSAAGLVLDQVSIIMYLPVLDRKPLHAYKKMPRIFWIRGTAKVSQGKSARTGNNLFHLAGVFILLAFGTRFAVAFASYMSRGDDAAATAGAASG